MNGEKPSLIVEAQPETGEISVGADLDGDGKPDIGYRTFYKDKRFWIVVGILTIVLLAGNQAGFW